MQRKFICGLVLVVFIANMVLPYGASAQTLNLPALGQLLSQSGSYSLPVLKGLKLNPKNPLKIDFIIDTANQGKVSKEEAAVLIRYFLAGIAMPDKDIWVNLSPYEQDRVVPQALGETDLGRDLLAEDYVLKQLAASLTYPETDAGKKYWNEINGRDVIHHVSKNQDAINRVSTTGTTQSFNKVWIIPGKAKVYEHQNLVMVKDATLKVMTEEDYVAGRFDTSRSLSAKRIETNGTLSDRATNAFKAHILPLIEQDVNIGKNFAQLRQIYSAMILAKWFKDKFKTSFYRYYINSANNKGIDINDKTSKDKIYAQYVEAFQKGVYNYVKRDWAGPKKIAKRAYFSGGAEPMPSRVEAATVTANQVDVGSLGPLVEVPVEIGDSNASEREDIAKIAGDLVTLIKSTRLSMGNREFTLAWLVNMCEDRGSDVGVSYLAGIGEARLKAAVDVLAAQEVLEIYRDTNNRRKKIYRFTEKRFDPSLTESAKPQINPRIAAWFEAPGAGAATYRLLTALNPDFAAFPLDSFSDVASAIENVAAWLPETGTRDYYSKTTGGQALWQLAIRLGMKGVNVDTTKPGDIARYIAQKLRMVDKIDRHRKPSGKFGEHPGKNPRDVAQLIEDLSLEAFTIRELQAHYQRNAARLGYDLPAALTTLRKDLDKLVVRGFLEIKANGGGYNKEYTYARTDMLLDDYLRREPVQAVKDIVNSVSRKFFRNIRRGYKGEARAEYYFHGIAGKKMPFRAFKAKVIEAIAAAQITDLGEVKRLVEKVFENISYFNDRPDKGSGRPYCIDIRFEHALGLLSGSEFKRSPQEGAGFQDWLKKDEAGQIAAALFAWLGIKGVTSFHAAADAIVERTEENYWSQPTQYSSWGSFYLENDAGALLSRLAKELKVEFNAEQSPVYVARAIALGLIKKETEIIRDDHGRFAEHPGKSPRAAADLILFAGLNKFDLDKFLAAYGEHGQRLGFEPLAEYPESTARRDLAVLVRKGILTVTVEDGRNIYSVADREKLQEMSDKSAGESIIGVGTGPQISGRLLRGFFDMGGMEDFAELFRGAPYRPASSGSLRNYEEEKMIREISSNGGFGPRRASDAPPQVYLDSKPADADMSAVPPESNDEGLRDPQGRFETQKGKSPQDAAQLILKAGLIMFTLQEFLLAYEERKQDLGFDDLAQDSEPAARRSLQALTDAGALAVKRIGSRNVYAVIDSNKLQEAVGGINMADISLEVSPGTVPAEFNGINADFFKRMNFTIFNLRNNISFNQLLR